MSQGPYTRAGWLIFFLKEPGRISKPNPTPYMQARILFSPAKSCHQTGLSRTFSPLEWSLCDQWHCIWFMTQERERAEHLGLKPISFSCRHQLSLGVGSEYSVAAFKIILVWCCKSSDFTEVRDLKFIAIFKTYLFPGLSTPTRTLATHNT